MNEDIQDDTEDKSDQGLAKTDRLAEAEQRWYARFKERAKIIRALFPELYTTNDDDLPTPIIEED